MMGYGLRLRKGQLSVWLLPHIRFLVQRGRRFLLTQLSRRRRFLVFYRMKRIEWGGRGWNSLKEVPLARWPQLQGLRGLFGKKGMQVELYYTLTN